MIADILFFLKLLILFLPFFVAQFFNKKANYNKNVRYKQFAMPLVSVIYFIFLFVFSQKFYSLCESFSITINQWCSEASQYAILNSIKLFLMEFCTFISIMIFNCLMLLIYIVIKRITLLFFKKEVEVNSFKGEIIGLFYEYDQEDNEWYLKDSFGQARTYAKTAYYIVYVLSLALLMASYKLYTEQSVMVPYSPIFSIIVIGEIVFFLDGLRKSEKKSSIVVSADNSKHIAMYAMLRKPLKLLFGDKLASEGTTINTTGISGGSCEDVLAGIEQVGGHLGKNYATFMRRKMDSGFAPNVDYLRTGYDLATGKSLLFNTPFYDKLVPYVFYAMNRTLLKGNKILVVLGRHGTEDDLIKWCEKGLKEVTNTPDLYKIRVLSNKSEEDLFDIGIISRSGVHDLYTHKANMEFLSNVGFVFIVEPSRLVTTAQIGLNLLIRCCGKKDITYCSVDRNCDGLVDSMSHILMTDITEVSATEYPHGMSSFMCWTTDDDYLQHRLIPGVSRYLGLGTELSFAALKNQVKQTVWYGGDIYPVLDARWIAKQYYYDLLKYAQLPTTQESFDKYFKTSFNMCNEKVDDYSYVSVEDDRSNLFEARRNFATIAEKQGFVNVISSEYMLREYMAENTEIFTVDPKAIPYVTADYARTRRNSILVICLLLCIDGIREEELRRMLTMIGISGQNLETIIWKEIFELFSNDPDCDFDKEGNPVLKLESVDKACDIVFDMSSVLIAKREYSINSGKFEKIYSIENDDFANIILDDLTNAGYIAERESEDNYIGTELKGHIYQKYLPGQFFTLNGKYYEMISVTPDNKILVRRASEHIKTRLTYRQVRKYNIKRIRSTDTMGSMKTVNNIDIHFLNADFDVTTSGYWKMSSYNDFEKGTLLEINDIPTRKYFNKQILKLDFSKLGDLFTDSIKKTLTALLNETFVTLFAENHAFISAVIMGDSEIPNTYSLDIEEHDDSSNNCIYIIEDSQLDIGLLVAVERNINRIMQIISDYLIWNNEMIESSKERERLQRKEKNEDSEPIKEETQESEELQGDEEVAEEEPKSKNIFAKIGNWFKSFFGKFKKKEKQSPKEDVSDATDETDSVPDGAKEDAEQNIEQASEADMQGDELEDNTESDTADSQQEIDESEDEKESEVVYSE